MRIGYILLSPTFGMHQYTADYANHLARQGHDVHLVTTAHFPRDRYDTAVSIHTPLDTTNTGLSGESLRLGKLRGVLAAVDDWQPDVVHITGPHLWNVPLLRKLKQRGYPVLHTIHDLDPHSGARMGRLLHLWNALILRQSDHILVHGQMYRQRLLSQGIPQARVTYLPLLHLFLSQEQTAVLETADFPITYEPFALFFGRLAAYKGLDTLLTAYAQAKGSNGVTRLVLAGPGRLPPRWENHLPSGVELRNRLIGDAEALNLFRRCRLVLLPYSDATQSALIPAAYFFRKPVLVTRTGALAEYVRPGETGFVVQANDPDALAQKLALMLNNPARCQALGTAGRAWYEQNRQPTMHTLIDLYRKLSQTRIAYRVSRNHA